MAFKKEKLIVALTVANSIALALLLGAGAVVFVLTKGFIAATLWPKITASAEAELFKSQFVARLRSVQLWFTKGQEPPGSAVDLPVYEIKISTANLRQIQLHVEGLLQKKGMTDEDKLWFPCKFYHAGVEYDAKIRLRGDLPGHWSQPKKSWRVRFQNEKFFAGHRELDLIIPFDKGYVEQIAHDIARLQGLLVPDSGFARVRLNGVDMGLYFWSDRNTKETLEKLQYPEGEFFRENNTSTHSYIYKYGSFIFTQFTGNYTNMVHKDPNLGFFAERWNHLITLLREGDDERFAREIPRLVDMEKYLRWNAITWLFGTIHSHWGPNGDNLRWYYDPTVGLLEPVLYDIVPAALAYDRSGTFEHKETDPLAKRILMIPEHQQRRNAILWGLLNDPAYDLAERAEKEFRALRPLLFQGVDADPPRTDREHNETIEILRGNREDLKGYLQFTRVFVAPELSFRERKPVLTLKLLPDALARIAFKKAAITFAEPLPGDVKDVRLAWTDSEGRRQPVERQSAAVEKNVLTVDLGGLPFWSRRDAQLLPVLREWTLEIELPDAEGKAEQPGWITDITYEFANAISGESVPGLFVSRSPLSLKTQDHIDAGYFTALPELIKATRVAFREEGGNLVLDEGEHVVARDLTVPVNYGLVLRPGATLKMGPGASLIVYKPVRIEGTKEKPVRVIPLDDKAPWGSFAVINAGGKSSVRHLLVRGGKEDRINGLFVSGQLCFYSSPVEIYDSEIREGNADDGLNIKRAEFTVKNTRFVKNHADAFDGDWVRGTVENSLFLDNGGDGLDLSGSMVVAKNNLFSGSGDKGASIGEKTEFYGINNVFRKSLIGLAAKDLSRAHVYASVFYDNGTALSAYRKKQLFGGGTVEAVSTLFWKNKTDFKPDAESRIKLTGAGVEQWAPLEGVEADDLRQGDIGGFYAADQAGNVLPVKDKIGSSPFNKGPDYKPGAVAAGVELPDFTSAPIGLTARLDAAP